MSKAVVETLISKFGDAIVEAYAHRGDETVVVDRTAVVEIAEFLKSAPEMSFDMPIDATAVDYLEAFESYRFEVVYTIYSTGHKHRLRIKVRLDEDDIDTPSLANLWKGMNWPERETYDMFGINFVGHPDLRRLLLYPDFQGHPLRKDFDFDEIQPLVEFIPVDVPMSLGTPFHGTRDERGIVSGSGTSPAGKPVVPQEMGFEPDVRYK